MCNQEDIQQYEQMEFPEDREEQILLYITEASKFFIDQKEPFMVTLENASGRMEVNVEPPLADEG